MSNKFLKIFGICVMAIMLPVLIAVSAVCLATNNSEQDPGKEPSGEGEQATYTVVSGNYAEDVTLAYNEETQKWELSAIPTRAYYNFTGIKVAGNIYTVVENAIAFNEAEQEAFEKALENKDTVISANWECQYSSIYLLADSFWDDLGQCFFTDNEFDPNVIALETQGVFSLLQYDFEGNDPITSVEIQDLNNYDTMITITITDADRTINGQDITFKTLLDKIAEQQGVLKTKTGTNALELALIG